MCVSQGVNINKGRHGEGERAVCPDGHARGLGEGEAAAKEGAPAPLPAPPLGVGAGVRAAVGKDGGFDCDACCQIFSTLQACYLFSLSFFLLVILVLMGLGL